MKYTRQAIDRCRETALPCPLSKAMYLTYLKNAVSSDFCLSSRYTQRVRSNQIATYTGLRRSKRGPPFLYHLGQINDRHEMSPVVKQTGKVFRRAVQFFQGESGNYFDCAPAISGVAIVLYIK